MNIDKHRRNSQFLTHTKYRPDIDGLRSVSILSVIGFHTFPNLINGGFVGVDIFFVISGYLISTIILGGINDENFNFKEFYVRRINRIFPALLLVLISCFVFGWFVLLADEYKQLGKHIAGGAGFISNYLYLNSSGYFDSTADMKPLLHLWSLAIEEQFYIVWPLLLFYLCKKRLNILTIIFVLFVTSFAINIDKTVSDSVAAYYSPQARFWELLAGSILAYFTIHRSQRMEGINHWIDGLLGKLIYTPTPLANGETLGNIKSFIGAGLIVLGMFTITKEKQFPGWWALIPVLGAVLIISAGSQTWFNRTVLSNRILVWFGLISFPLYLWHWPLLAFVRILESEPPSNKLLIFVILVSILLSWLTFEFVEKIFRYGKHSFIKSITLIFLMIIIGYIGYNCFKRDGLAFRLNDRADFSLYFENSSPDWKYFNKINLFEKYNDKCNFYNIDQHRLNKYTSVPISAIDLSCYQRDSASYNRAVFIWGDSHASHLYFGLKKNLPVNWQILQVASSMCNPDITPKEASVNNYCTQSNWFALNTINETKPDVVIIAQNSGHNIEFFNKTSSMLQAMGVKKIIFAGPTPHWAYELPKIILKELWFNTPQRTHKSLDPGTVAMNMSLQLNFRQSDSVLYANLIDTFCNQEGCLTYIGDNKKTGITSFDFGHLTPIASDYLAKNLLVKLIIDDYKTSTIP
jgi:peptidoglycan/LPS O-acetylase OafA/YrhL